MFNITIAVFSTSCEALFTKWKNDAANLVIFSVKKNAFFPKNHIL